MNTDGSHSGDAWTNRSGNPGDVARVFPEYELESLDPEQNAFTVIERTLAWGDWLELRWLFDRYGAERLSVWVRQFGWRCLPRRSLKFWLCFFGITEYERGERIWPQSLHWDESKAFFVTETRWLEELMRKNLAQVVEFAS